MPCGTATGGEEMLSDTVPEKEARECGEAGRKGACSEEKKTHKSPLKLETMKEKSQNVAHMKFRNLEIKMYVIKSGNH